MNALPPPRMAGKNLFGKNDAWNPGVMADQSNVALQESMQALERIRCFVPYRLYIFQKTFRNQIQHRVLVAVVPIDCRRHDPHFFRKGADIQFIEAA